LDPATNILDVYQACHPEAPLEPEDPRYVDLREVRGGRNLARIIYRRIASTGSSNYHQHLITGHRGCGKSTELRQIKGALEEENLFCVYFDVEEVLDVQDIEYLDVLLAIARVVSERLYEEAMALPEDLLTHLDDWFADIVFTKEKYEEREEALQSEFGIDTAKVPLLRFLSAITSSIRSGGDQRVRLRKQIRRELNDFFERLNDLLTAAQKRVREDYDDLVVIVDGLEKMPYRLPEETQQSNHSTFFIQHAEALKKPHCHVIYTVPISLILNNNLADAFPDYEVIPMVAPEGRGREKLREVVRRRVSIDDIFESEAGLDRIVDICGGALRDLLRVIRFACDETDDIIGTPEVDRAIQKLVREYDYQVKEEDIPTLKQVAEHERLTGDETSARLRHQRLVLEYYNEDGQRYADVHPAVRRVERVQQALSQ
jgi:energy-coupling factor transporter ATP-binding protein EcfA2